MFLNTQQQQQLQAIERGGGGVMIKTERLAAKLFGGSLYDCMCSF